MGNKPATLQSSLFAELKPPIFNAQGSEWLDEYLSVSDLHAIANRVETWSIEGSSAKLSYLSHGFFRYFGKFPPPVATHYIRELHDPNIGPVLDPMMGSGTTLVEALIQDRSSVGLDVNPLSVLIAKVKTTVISRDDIMSVLDRYCEHMKLRPTSDIGRFIPKDQHLDHWFYTETQESIAWTRLFIENYIEDARIQNLFLVALASNIRRFSRASNGLGRMFLDPAILPQDVQSIMSKKIADMALVVEQIAQYQATTTIYQHNAQDPFDVPKTNLVICHPPYFNLYRYSSIYKFEMLWLGFSSSDVRPQEVREGFKLGKAYLVDQYVEDLGKVIGNIERVLVPGGWCILMMGDTVIHGNRINTTFLTGRFIKDKMTSLNIEKLVIRQPKFTEASYAATQRRKSEQIGVKLQDHLLVLQKLG